MFSTDAVANPFAFVFFAEKRELGRDRVSKRERERERERERRGGGGTDRQTGIATDRKRERET